MSKAYLTYHKYTLDNQIRKLLDPIAAKTVFGTFTTVYQWLEKQRIINQFKYLENQVLVGLDGTEYYSSPKINCPYCNCREHRNGKKTYYHQVITPVLNTVRLIIKQQKEQRQK